MFAQDIKSDYLSADGWKLVYNTFNTTQLTSPEYFALYNVYRGLYRLYFYLPPVPPTNSTYMMEGLQLTGTASTSLLNFCGRDVVDPSTNVTATTTLLPYQIVSGGGWYVMQFEMAYDPNITNINYQNLETIWKLSSVNVTRDTLYGQGHWISWDWEP